MDPQPNGKRPKRKNVNDKADEALNKLKLTKLSSDSSESEDIFRNVTKEEYDANQTKNSDFVVGHIPDENSRDFLEIPKTKKPLISSGKPFDQSPINKLLNQNKKKPKQLPSRQTSQTIPLDLSLLSQIDGKIDCAADSPAQTTFEDFENKSKIRQEQKETETLHDLPKNTPKINISPPKKQKSLIRHSDNSDVIKHSRFDQHFSPKTNSAENTEIPVLAEDSVNSKTQTTISSTPKQFEESPSNDENHLATTKLNHDLKHAQIFVFYWIDAFEDKTSSPRSVYLFGKTIENKSCCVRIDNIPKTLYVRKKHRRGAIPSTEDFERHVRTTMTNSDIKPFTLRIVRRKYCFEDFRSEGLERTYAELTVPQKKGHSQGADLPAFSDEFVDLILGRSTSALEKILVSLKIKGPGWLMAAKATKSDLKFSWCKEELVLSDFKSLRPLSNLDSLNSLKSNVGGAEISELVKTSPKLSVLSVRLGIVKEKTRSEIVCISAIFVPEVEIDSSDSPDPQNLKRAQLESFVCVRPLKKNEFPKDFIRKIKQQKRSIRICSTERELFNFFLAKLQTYDPDVILGHNLHKHQLSLLLTRMRDLKVTNWSRICRVKKRKIPLPYPMERGLCCGRLYCDTRVAAIEFSTDTNYSLSHFATKVEANAVEIEPSEWRHRFTDSDSLLQAIGVTCNNCYVTLKLLFYLNVLPLSKQLTQLCGNLWARSLQSKRAERNEFLVLHELHSRKFLPKEKTRHKETLRLRKNARYAGGHVFEPIKGLYDKTVALLDFASLYPSIIKEYNICFTTIDRFKEFGEGENVSAVQDENAILPAVIEQLLQRRNTIKQFLLKPQDEKTRRTLDVRQKALKLVANSIYGCLGFEHWRFHCEEMASLITLLGRRNLLRAKEIAEKVDSDPPLKVIYGDTDSIMVDTGHRDITRLKKVVSNVLKAVNKQYRFMKLELDGLFAKLLLLQKKKYAAVVFSLSNPSETKLETKGLDLVRREWCPLSKELGRKVISELLSTSKSREEAVEEILLYLRAAKERIEKSEEPVAKFVITKALSKDPSAYNDAKVHPHVQVALAMRREGLSIGTGDHIPYIITKGQNNTGEKSMADRAVHSSKLLKENEMHLEVDTKWYMEHQIFPPLARLCGPIAELPANVISECLGLSSSKSVQNLLHNENYNAFGVLREKKFYNDVWRFAGIGEENKLPLSCRFGCRNGLWNDLFDAKGDFAIVCANKECKTESLLEDEIDVVRFCNALTIDIRRNVLELYRGESSCDSCCKRVAEGRMSSVCGENCGGELIERVSSAGLLERLIYLKSLFEIPGALERARIKMGLGDSACKRLEESLPYGVKQRLKKLSEFVEHYLKQNGYYFIDPRKVLGEFVV